MIKPQHSPLPLLLCLLFAGILNGQTLRFYGNVKDSSGPPPPNVLLMVMKLSDSTLVGHARSNEKGDFKSLTVPKDTYEVIIAHPAFSDKTYLVFPSPSDSVYHLKNIILPPKTNTLLEVEVLAFRDRMYYKGDTMVFTADSFKTKPDASVEDLLKKLPGFRVDSKGKITVQGKEVDQVLVDGDEFFGGDPTVATKNLNAASVENVQVYEKKNESGEEGKDETLKVVNLKLKEDAKKGYFGRVAGATDAQRFYEGEFLANKFKGGQKISVFGLSANTPKQAFNWQDIDRYGLTNEQPWSYDEESGTWTSSNNGNEGIPTTFKAGAYYSDHYGKNTKANADFTSNDNRLKTNTENSTQYFLTDTVYTTRSVNLETKHNQSNRFGFSVEHKFDSLTTLTIKPNASQQFNESQSSSNDAFISSEGLQTRSTLITRNASTTQLDASVNLTFVRKFMKKDRRLFFNYLPSAYQNEATTRLNTSYYYNASGLRDTAFIQRREENANRREHTTNIIFTEPLTKKFKINLSYVVGLRNASTLRNTFDIGSGTDILNSAQSNNFMNTRLNSRPGLDFIYDVKKFRVTMGSQVQHIQQDNENLTTGQQFRILADFILPRAAYVYRFSQSTNLQVNYRTSARVPEVRDLQPVVDNTDPNNLRIGNPSLKPAYTHNGEIYYYFYKNLSEIYFWSGANFNLTNNDISYNTRYDALGKATTQAVNVNGNYNGNGWIGYSHPAFKQFINLSYNLNAGINKYVSFVNNQQTISKNTYVGPRLTIGKNAEAFEGEIRGEYNYNVPTSNISSLSNQPYYSWSISGEMKIKFPKKYTLNSDWNYTNNGNRMPGYNLNYFILNGGISKAFFKDGRLIVAGEIYDALNQNISNNRYNSSNTITDTKTAIIKRYYLFRLTYKFTSQKFTEEEGGEDE